MRAVFFFNLSVNYKIYTILEAGIQLFPIEMLHPHKELFVREQSLRPLSTPLGIPFHSFINPLAAEMQVLNLRGI